MIIEFKKFLENYKNANFFVKEDNNYFYVWKKAGVPSSFWKQKSILDMIKENSLEKYFCSFVKKVFTEKEEYWLLNRLDNDTSWFLYFAKNKEIYKDYKNKQKKGNIDKYYYAIIEWDFPYKKIQINYPIMHKNKSKMIAIKNKKDKKKWRWKEHFVKTDVERLYFDKKNNKTYLKVCIKKGIRHQIRCHLASICYPIIGDKLYDWKENNILWLYSVWFKKNF